MSFCLKTLAQISLILGLAGCGMCTTGEGENQQEVRLVPEFQSIELNGSANVVIREYTGTEPLQIIVDAQSNLLPQIATKVHDNTLHIDIEGCINSIKPITIFVYANQIGRLSLLGSGNIEAAHRLSGDKTELFLEGSGNIDLAMQVNRIIVHQNGSGNVSLNGNTNELDIMLTGSGNCETMSMISENSRVNLSGSGTVQVFGKREMQLSLTGSGSIFYGGNPEKLNTSDNGSGEIHEAQ